MPMMSSSLASLRRALGAATLLGMVAAACGSAPAGLATGEPSRAQPPAARASSATTAQGDSSPAAGSASEAQRRTSILRTSGDWITDAIFVGHVLPWLPGVSNDPCEIVDYEGTSRVVRVRTLAYDDQGRLTRVSARTPRTPRLERDPFCLPSGLTEAVLTHPSREWCIASPREPERPICTTRDDAGITGWSNGEDVRATVHRDARGRTERIESSYFHGEGGAVWTMSYDDAGRLARASVEAYDDAGDSEESYVYTYDARGELTDLTHTGRAELSDRMRFSYDAEGRLASCERDGVHVTYDYDARGRLIRRTATRGRGRVIAATELRYECVAPATE